VVLDLKPNQLSNFMSFLKYHQRLGDYIPIPDCTIFNYDLIYFLNEDGPFLWENSMGGYISPDLGGKIVEIDWNLLKKDLLEQKPGILIIPECLVNNYHKQCKLKIENDIKELGYYDDRLIVYLQKEQNFYYGEIHDKPDWFYEDELDYKNICYHSIGYNTPPKEEDETRFKNFRFCKQGFMCESFHKLYSIKDTSPDELWEQRLKTNFEPGKLIWYGNLYTSIRNNVTGAIKDSIKVHYKNVVYGNESLTDLVLGEKGIGISMDGLVFNTIRDAEFGVVGLPSIKVTRANNYLIEHNNVDMFGCRQIIQVQDNIFTNADDELIKKQVEEGYERYFELDHNDYGKTMKNIRYHFFIILLQKFNNIEFFVFDILFGDKIKDFVDNLDIKVDYSIFEKACNVDPSTYNKGDVCLLPYMENLLTKFREYFKLCYIEWYKTLNNKNDSI